MRVMATLLRGLDEQREDQKSQQARKEEKPGRANKGKRGGGGKAEAEEEKEKVTSKRPKFGRKKYAQEGMNGPREKVLSLFEEHDLNLGTAGADKVKIF